MSSADLSASACATMGQSVRSESHRLRALYGNSVVNISRMIIIFTINNNRNNTILRSRNRYGDGDDRSASEIASRRRRIPVVGALSCFIIL